MININQLLNQDEIYLLKNHVIIHNTKVVLPPDIHKQTRTLVKDFAEKMNSKGQSTTYYTKQRAASNALKNIETGKYGEVVAWLVLISCGFPSIKIDFDIRSGEKKGWVCDLPFSGKDNKYPDCHVKTCDFNTVSFLRNQDDIDEWLSWTFQYKNINNIGGRDSLFNNNSQDLVIFMYIPDIDQGWANLVATAPWFHLKDLFTLPILKKLQKIKRCINYQDLKQNCHEQISRLEI